MASAQTDRDTFLHNLRLSRLLGADEYRRAVDRHGKLATASDVAKGLIKDRLLTKFQAKMLLAGRASGFFLGPYRILDVLGRGGMGRVYKALHSPMNRTVALKVLVPNVVKTEKARALFQREVEAAAQLHHPNIVVAYDAGAVDGRHFLAMEYVEGPNLETLVRKHGPLPVGAACGLMVQAAAALQHAHTRGMVHRDIKPANLVLSEEPAASTPLPTLKVLDFGLARLGHASAAAGGQTIVTTGNVVMGTPDFLSPEQSKDLHKVDGRTDLYSLGATLYYLLSGRVPFPGGSSLDKLLRHHAEEPAPLEDLRPEVPLAVIRIVRRLMAKKPDDRFQTAQQLIDALAPYVAPTWDAAPVATAAVPTERKPGIGLDDDTAPHSRATTDISGEMPSFDLDGTEPRPGRGALLWVCAAVVALMAAGAALAFYAIG